MQSLFKQDRIMQKMITVNINNQEYEVQEDCNIVEACDAHNIPLQRFCYHRYLPVDGSCRTCMVEIETPQGMMVTTACTTKVKPGMAIYTNSEKAVAAQKSALEFLLLDHPLDCPICDKAGECLLQDNYFDFGRYDFRRTVARYFKGGKALNAGEHIVLDQERCILCRRCIRFFDEIVRTPELGIISRGHESSISLFPEKFIRNPYSGNSADICPVGALTLKEFRFKQRVWFLKKTKSICTQCARGCSIYIEHNKNTVWRFMPRENPALNRVWMCDRGRFSFNKLHEKRIFTPLKHQEEISFNQLYDDIAELLKTRRSGEIAWVVGPFSSNETYYALKTYCGDNAVCLMPPASGERDDLLMLAEEYPNAQGATFFGLQTETAPLIDKIQKGRIAALIIVEMDLFNLRNDSFAQCLMENIHKIPLKIYLTAYRDETVARVDYVVPVRTYAETNGTFINATSLLQKACQALVPEHPDIDAACIALYTIATGARKHQRRYSDASEMYDKLRSHYDELRSFQFNQIPEYGIALNMPKRADEPFKGIHVDFNVCSTAKPLEES